MSKLFSSLNKEVKAYKSNVDQTTSANLYDRREFIRQTAKGAAGTALALSLPSFLASCDNSNTGGEDMLDVAILGGGIAGLNCANHLLQSNLNFKIFEADRRVGGRILTHYNDGVGLGVFPEFGGDFIDSGHEDMLALAKEFNLELLDLEEEVALKNLTKDTYYFDNRRIDEKEIIQEFQKIAEKVANDKDSLGEDYDTPEAEELDGIPLYEYIRSLHCSPWLKDLFTAAFTSEFGLDCTEQSTLNFLDMIDTDTSEGFKIFGESDERYRIKGGNSKIIEGLVRKIGDDKIEKGYEVQEVTENEDGTYRIVFKDNKEVLAKAIVCTIPFTILRNIKLNLKNISADKRKCIDELGYGMNTKLVLGYDGAPWSDNTNKAMGYLFHKDIVNGWDSSYNKTDGNTNGAYVCYFGGAFSKDLDTQSSKHPMAPPTHVWKTALPQERVEGFVDDLDKIFVGSKSKFIDKHIFVNWIDFPYTRGSYSCYKVGQWSSIAGLEIEPVGKFFFAGEHCSEMFQGYMNGGAETGRSVAEEILEGVGNQG